MRMRLNDGWQFAKGEAKDFTPVSLPHDWLITDPRNWYQTGIGWYQRSLDTGFLQPGQRAILRFDGVYMNSTLYVNSHKAGEWKYGFTAFEHDITAFLKEDGDNTLLLKVDARFPSSRWYTGAGIYREVSLHIKNPCHFINDGVYITTDLVDGQWVYEVTADVETQGAAYEVSHQLLEAGEIIPWSPDCPQLYTLRSTLLVNHEVCDTVDTSFGFRQLRFDPEDGFFINGEKTKLNGVCLHQEFAIIGSAVHADFIRRQFLALKRMGVNAIRAAHNPPSKVQMDLADELGLMVISEFADVWQLRKTEHDYARYFDAWHERDIASWIRRDRNHPSIILWSLGNEIPDTHADFEKGSAVLKTIRDLVRLHDPRGQALPTLGSNYMAWENTQKAVEQLPVVGYNYAEFLYQRHHEQHPDWVIYGSETGSTVQSRGIYHFPLSQPLLSDDDLQTSSLGNSTTSWGTKSVDHVIKDDRDTPFSIGQFVWTGQDYLGEPTPYHTKNSYFGMMDTAGFEKDAFYQFQSAWTKEPVVHLFPYWDFSPGQLIDARVTSNQHAVALFINDRFVSMQEMGSEITRNWQLPYEKGVLRADAYDETGKLMAQAFRHSFGEAEQLHLAYERQGDTTFVQITAVDKDGHLVENANNLVEVSVSQGVLLGLDNGDSTDYTPYQNNTRRMFSGKLLAVAKGKNAEFEARIIKEDAPVRKIELVREGYTIHARALPQDAKAQQLHWRLTNAAGVDSRNAAFSISEDEKTLTLSPVSDGRVYVRCGVNNGKDHLDLYTQLEVDLTGFGQKHLDPYEEVSASLFTYSNVALTNGNDRGVATLREAESWVCFDNLDFGAHGSDRFNIWLFPLHHDPFHFEVWKGRPDQGGSLLAKPLYDKGMIWNTYVETPVQLNETLKGNTPLCFVFHVKSHIRGFVFHKKTRGFEPIAAGACEELYGDSFIRAGDAVKNIGNNTTLGFSGFDFGDVGTDSLEVSYQSMNDSNPLQIQFDSAHLHRAMVHLPKAAEKTALTIPLEGTWTGQGEVRLVFLPGASLDLYGIRFVKKA